MSAPKKRKPNIFDLEKASGFSRSTISRVFNQQAGVHAATRDKILRVAEEIGYAPHAGAKLIRGAKTMRLGIILRNFDNPHFAELVSCMGRLTNRLGYTLLMMFSHGDAQKESQFLRNCASGEADGVLIDAASPDTNSELYERIRKQGYPLVFLHGRPNSDFDVVIYSFRNGIEQAVRTLFSLGHEHVGYIAPDHGWAKETDRYMGYVDAHEAEGREIDEDYVYLSPPSDTLASSAWLHWNRTVPLPTAVLCYNDLLASQLYEFVRGRAIRVPEDLSVCGGDDIRIARLLGLSSIRIDRELTASEILQLLTSRMERPDLKGRAVSIPTELILRESIGRCPKRC